MLLVVAYSLKKSDQRVVRDPGFFYNNVHWVHDIIADFLPCCFDFLLHHDSMIWAYWFVQYLTNFCFAYLLIDISGDVCHLSDHMFFSQVFCCHGLLGLHVRITELNRFCDLEIPMD